MPVETVGGSTTSPVGLHTFPGEGTPLPAGTGPLVEVTNFFRRQAGRPPLPAPGQAQPYAPPVGGDRPLPAVPEVLPMWAADP